MTNDSPGNPALDSQLKHSSRKEGDKGGNNANNERQPAVDMAAANFNKDYQVSIFSKTAPFNLPQLILFDVGSSGSQAHRPQDAVHQTAKDAPHPADKPGAGGREAAGVGGRLFSHTHTANTDGGYTEQHTGPRPEDNYVLTKTGEGRYLVAAKPGDTPVELDKTNASDIRLQRARLNELADQHIKDPAERAAFAQNMAKLEERSQQLHELYMREGVSAAVAARKARAEIAKTYERVCAVLEATDRPGSPIHEKERVMIAGQIVNHAANPTDIDQGQHLTCNVATIESRTYARHPSDAAKLVADVAITGQYVARDGTRVVIDNGSLTPDKEAQAAHPPDGSRDLASQLFQVTAVNIWYQKHDPAVHYEQTQDGERLYRYAADGSRSEVREGVGFWGWLRGEEGTPTRSPSLVDSNLVEVGNTITGDQGATNWFFEHQQVSENNTVHVESQRDLERMLADAKAHGRLPVVIAVHTGNEPFHTDSDGGTAGGSGGVEGGWHVVNVTDFIPAHNGRPAMVSIDNQWGSGADHFGDHQMTARQLYLSMRPATDSNQLQEYRDAIRDDRRHGRATLNDQLDLLRLEKAAGNLSDVSFQRQLNTLTLIGSTQYQRQEREGHVDTVALNATLHKIMDVVNQLPADKRIEEISRIQNQYTMPGHEFQGNSFMGDWAARVYISAWKDYRQAQQNHTLDDEQMNRMQRVMQVYRQINARMPQNIQDRMQQILRDGM